MFMVKILNLGQSSYTIQLKPIQLRIGIRRVSCIFESFSTKYIYMVKALTYAKFISDYSFSSMAIN